MGDPSTFPKAPGICILLLLLLQHYPEFPGRTSEKNWGKKKNKAMTTEKVENL